ncbi:MAG: Gfo/Idh/MocA family oxidoreductase [Tepidisphaeraceae bacterium]
MPTIAFVGCAHIHTPGFINMIKGRSDTTVKYVWDHLPARGEVRAKETGATLVSDLNVIANDKAVDGVVICTETDRHEQLVLQFAAARKHLFVEKPLGIGAADAYKMADAIEKAGVKFQTGYFQRGAGAVLKLKELVGSGAFGTITRVRGSNCHSGSLGGWFDSKPNDVANDWRWMADVKQSGVGAFGDLGTHSLDILLWLFGEVKSVTAQLDPVTKRYPGTDESGEAMIRFKSGVIGTLAAGWTDVANPVQYIVSGTKGHATIIDGKLHLNLPDQKLNGVVDDLPKGLPHAFELFLDALAGKQVSLVGAREAAYRSAVMEAMYAGAKDSAWKDVK